MKRNRIILLALILLIHISSAQETPSLSINTGNISDQNYQLVKDVLLGNSSSGIEILDVKHNRGGTEGIARFTNGLSTLGFNQGILLSTGNPNIALGSNNSVSASSQFTDSNVEDIDLWSIASSGFNEMHDASVLEIDFKATCNNFSFRYVFASEEYNEYVCSNFNDIFGFFIFDLAEDGTLSNRRNIALISGTNLAVAINTVNVGRRGSHAGTNNCTLQYSNFYKNNANVSTDELPDFDRSNIQNPPYNIQYDGFTVPFTATIAGLDPNKKYRIKLAVADLGDERYDSGVFIEAGSFQSGNTPIVIGPNEVCPQSPIELTSDLTGTSYKWFRNGALLSQITKTILISESGNYQVEVQNGGCSPISPNFEVTSGNCQPCAECITSFSPIPDQRYLLTAWVKESFVGLHPKTYSNGAVRVTFNNGAVADDTKWLFRPQGPVVDGWQRIESSFTVPTNANNIQIELVNESTTIEVYFDDIRVHPFRSNMKSFVYDPSSQRLVAELDENNYATLYEYDDEGILIRVKKETERGLMTIKESRNNQSKIFK